jgi:hypothetical protein
VAEPENRGGDRFGLTVGPDGAATAWLDHEDLTVSLLYELTTAG